MSSTLRSPARVLLMVDQPILAEVIKLALNHGVFRVQVVQTPDDVLIVLRQWHPHLVIIDMDLAAGQVLDQLKHSEPVAERVPVVALTRRGDLKTKLAAFERGVDDILVVPFSPEELVARVLAIMRRTYREAPVFTPALQVGELEIDILNRSVRIAGHELHLTSLEQSLLYLLVANSGRVITRDEILDYLWGVDFISESNVVDRHVRNLRIKLQDDWKRPRYIATVPGKGYRFLPMSAD
ncbi:MAG TPA: response regulator transcription factor [Chloroflexota bacterium]|nr:response regulator transcription factor [Chloroflexota bacterium]